MNEKEKMISGLPFLPGKDGLRKDRVDCRLKVQAYNRCDIKKRKKIDKIMRSILGKAGEKVFFEPPFRCDYGKNIEIGDNFFANYNCIILDCAKVIIGNNVLFGPSVSLYTTSHPLDVDSRNKGYEKAKKIEICDNVWIGGNTVINPGVKIGKNSVIGSGSVVTKDIPENCIAFGNPCRVIREISEEDKNKFWEE